MQSGDFRADQDLPSGSQGTGCSTQPQNKKDQIFNQDFNIRIKDSSHIDKDQDSSSGSQGACSEF